MGVGPLASPVCVTAPEPTAVLPSLVGLDLAAATVALDVVGWTVPGGLPALPVASSDVPYLAQFVVTAQSPAPGAILRRCQTPQVQLVVATAG